MTAVGPMVSNFNYGARAVGDTAQAVNEMVNPITNAKSAGQNFGEAITEGRLDAAGRGLIDTAAAVLPGGKLALKGAQVAGALAAPFFGADAVDRGYFDISRTADAESEGVPVSALQRQLLDQMKVLQDDLAATPPPPPTMRDVEARIAAMNKDQIKAFQAANDLAIDGDAGTQTKATLLGVLQAEGGNDPRATQLRDIMASLREQQGIDADRAFGQAEKLKTLDAERPFAERHEDLVRNLPYYGLGASTALGGVLAGAFKVLGSNKLAKEISETGRKGLEAFEAGDLPKAMQYKDDLVALRTKHADELGKGNLSRGELAFLASLPVGATNVPLVSDLAQGTNTRANKEAWANIKERPLETGFRLVGPAVMGAAVPAGANKFISSKFSRRTPETTGFENRLRGNPNQIAEREAKMLTAGGLLEESRSVSAQQRADARQSVLVGDRMRAVEESMLPNPRPRIRGLIDELSGAAESQRNQLAPPGMRTIGSSSSANPTSPQPPVSPPPGGPNSTPPAAPPQPPVSPPAGPPPVNYLGSAGRNIGPPEIEVPQNRLGPPKEPDLSDKFKIPDVPYSIGATAVDVATFATYTNPLITQPSTQTMA